MSALPDSEKENKDQRDKGVNPNPDGTGHPQALCPPGGQEQPAAELPPIKVDDLAAAAPEPPFDAMMAALDQLAHPILALQPDGLLVHANLAASELLASGKPFVLGTDQRVQPLQNARRSAFLLALQAAAAGQAQPLHWVDDDVTTVHGVMRPLQVGPSVHGTGRRPAPVMVVLAPPADAHFDASGFAATYQLSRAETRVLEVLLHGGQAEEAAARLGVGVATVRSQIAAIRKKAGYSSVASLLAALGDLPPLRHVNPPPAAEGK
jgi:DNA-binding CsgD family transcriptional regulator